ncbi:MAG: bacterioferritin-associated ferredoxin [Planctomycetota bacterium]|jgi:bacterioferritin-associated ferredoxin
MIICHCTGATDREIKRCARATGNAGSAGSFCGGCSAEVTRLINLEKPCQAPGKGNSKSEGRKLPKPHSSGSPTA